jgi:phosphinothricin acetyltransferase
LCSTLIRSAEEKDLVRLTEIYNYYVVNTPVTFDVEPWSVDRRALWFEQFARTGRYRLLVAEKEGRVVGYAGTTRFRPKAAYDPTVETTIYLDTEVTGQGLGKLLYTALFETISQEDIHRILAGYALPNPASAALHRSFGFIPVGIFSQNGRKLNRYWDVAWNERPLRLPVGE